jgi:bacterioferritin (cytochrome b1)
MARKKKKSRAGRTPILTKAQKEQVIKEAEKVVRREVTQKGKPAFTKRQEAVMKRMIGEMVTQTLKQIAQINAMPPVKRRKRKK